MNEEQTPQLNEAPEEKQSTSEIKEPIVSPEEDKQNENQSFKDNAEEEKIQDENLTPELNVNV